MFKGSEYGPKRLKQKIRDSLMDFLRQLDLALIRDESMEKKTMLQVHNDMQERVPVKI